MDRDVETVAATELARTARVDPELAAFVADGIEALEHLEVHGRQAAQRLERSGRLEAVAPMHRSGPAERHLDERIDEGPAVVGNALDPRTDCVPPAARNR